MTVWIDAQLPPRLSIWFHAALRVDATHVRELGLLRATDLQIYGAARRAGATVLTKDRDFAELSNRLGPPPQIVLVANGNTSNKHLEEALEKRWAAVSLELGGGSALVIVEAGA